MTRYEILDTIFDLVSIDGSYMAVYNEIRRDDTYLLFLEALDFRNREEFIEYIEYYYL